MQSALRADSDRRFWSAPSPSNPRDKRLLLAGVAIAGASVIAINPVAPALPAVQDRAVELSAWIDPIGVWGNTLTSTFESVSARGSEIFTDGLPAAWEVISTSSLYTELAQAVFNPFPGLEQFFTNLPTYAATISAGIEASNAGMAEHLTELPAALEEAWDFVLQGQFTQAWASVVTWGLFGLGEAGWPLYPTFEIPGQIARDFGAPTIGAVLDALFVGDTTTTGYAYSLLGPPITAVYQLTDILNVISGSLYEGDWVTAVSEVINAPAKVLNAFLNGYQSSITPEWEVFPGIFSAGGPIDAFFVQLPKTIAAAIAAASEESEDESESETTTEDELAEVSSTELAADGDLVAVNVNAETDAGDATEEDAAEADAAAEETTEPEPAGEDAPVTDEDATTDEGTVPADETDDSVEDTDEATDSTDEESADEEAADDSATDTPDTTDTDDDKSDGDAGDKSDSDSKSDSKKSDSDSKSDSSKSDNSKSDKSKSGSDE